MFGSTPDYPPYLSHQNVKMDRMDSLGNLPVKILPGISDWNLESLGSHYILESLG